MEDDDDIILYDEEPPKKAPDPAEEGEPNSDMDDIPIMGGEYDELQPDADGAQPIPSSDLADTAMNAATTTAVELDNKEGPPVISLEEALRLPPNEPVLVSAYVMTLSSKTVADVRLHFVLRSTFLLTSFFFFFFFSL